MKLNHLLNPKIYNQSSCEYYIGDFSSRLLWHWIFDNAPYLRNLFIDNSRELVKDFMEYTFHEKICMDWKVNIYFLKWLENNNILDPNIRREMLLSSVAGWVIDHYSNINKDRILIIDYINNKAYGGIRSNVFGFDNKIISLNLEDNNKIDNDILYSTSNNDWDLINLIRL